MIEIPREAGMQIDQFHSPQLCIEHELKSVWVYFDTQKSENFQGNGYEFKFTTSSIFVHTHRAGVANMHYYIFTDYAEFSEWEREKRLEDEANFNSKNLPY